MPASLPKRHLIGAELLRFARKTGAGSRIIGDTYWRLGKLVRSKRTCAASMENTGGSSSVGVLCEMDREESLNGMERTLILKSGNVPRRRSGRMNSAYA
jgi:hypothetical protein